MDMAKMTVYHGGYEPVSDPEIRIGRNTKDFGAGFYCCLLYTSGEFIDGIQIADKLGLPHEKVYKTLVTVGNSKNYFVFVLPIEGELDLKKAAREVGEKSLAMLHVKDINTVTGYRCV